VRIIALRERQPKVLGPPKGARPFTSRPKETIPLDSDPLNVSGNRPFKTIRRERKEATYHCETDG